MDHSYITSLKSAISDLQLLIKRLNYENHNRRLTYCEREIRIKKTGKTIIEINNSITTLENEINKLNNLIK